MGFDFLSQAAKFLQERKEYRRWLTAFLCLALVVAFGTVTALKMYGQAMTHQEKVLDCRYEVHEHTEECYEENEDGENILICGLADYVIHVHNDDCYGRDGELVCLLEEHELHEHDDSCWKEEEVLICGEEETEGSAGDETAEETAEAVKTADEDSDAEESKTDAGNEKEPVCEKEEHTHDEGCYAEETGCEKEAHVHDDGCYETTKALVCEETEHVHDDGCYSKGELTLECDKGEHEHGDGCYDDEGNLICEEEEHTHDDSCYSAGEPVLTCEEPEHSHGDGCYEVAETLVCETEEHEHDDSCAAESERICEEEEHVHDDSCYTETEAEKTNDSESAEETKTEETVKPEESTENSHTHTDDCYRTEKVMACGEQEPHIHDDSCYDESCFDEDGNLIEGSRVSCGLLQLEEHVHTEECFRTDELTGEEVSERNRRRLETTLEYKEGLIRIIVTDDGLAGIPEDAELRVDLITEETDAELYQEQMHAAQELTGFSEENTGLLFHIRLLADEEEIELQDTVNMEFRIAADGFKEKSAVRTVCFGGDAPKELESTDLAAEEDGSLSTGFDSASSGQFALLIEDDGLPEGVYKKEFTQEYEDWTLKVIATYGEDAQIPEDAALVVEPITKESDENAYREKTDAARELTGYRGASAELLYNIGFFVDGEEIEPKGTVTMEFQLYRDGIEAGEPVTVIHFGEDEPKVLESTDMSRNEDGSLSTSFDSDSFSPFIIIVGGEEVRLVGLISKDGRVYEQADLESDIYELSKYEPALEEPLRIEVLETVTDVQGEAWYRYTAVTEDETLSEVLSGYSWVPAKDVALEGSYVQQILTATDDEGVTVTVKGLLPEDAQFSVNRIHDPEIADVKDTMRENMDGEAELGDFRLVYDMDLGTDRRLLEPVEVSVSNYDFSYDDYSNLSAWVYSMGTQEKQYSVSVSVDKGTEKTADESANQEEGEPADDSAGTEVEKTEAEIKGDGTITFQTRCLSTLYIASTLIEGHDEYFYSLAESGDTLQWEDIRYFLEEEEIEEGTEETAEEAGAEESEESMAPVRGRAMSRAAKGAVPADSSGQIHNKGGENNNTADKVTTSKTIAATGQENVFDITLKVTAPEQTFNEIIDPDIAVVIVMDVSNTMTYGFEDNTAPGKGDTARKTVAIQAGQKLIQQFYAKCGSKGNSRIGMVTFNTDAQQTFGLQTCKDTAKRDKLKGLVKEKVNGIINADGYDDGYDKYTNIEAGLKRAHDMLKDCANKNKYIILVTDGFPTTYIKSGYTGYKPRTGSEGTYNSSKDDGVFSDRVDKKDCCYGCDYSDKAAKRAAAEAAAIKKDKIEIYSVGVALGSQSVNGFIKKHKDHNFATVDITSSTYAVGKTTTSYKNWLRDTIGSGTGHYENGDTPEALTKAFDDILEKVVKYHTKTAQTVMTVTDPVPGAVEFIGFYDKNGALKGQAVKLTGSHSTTGENDAAVASNTINWNLQKSKYTSSTKGTVTTYTYTLKYRVRLKNEAGSFAEGTVYNTNGTTTLKYKTDVTTKINNKETTASTNKSINFKVPSVQGYLTKLEFNKVDSKGDAVEGAVFTLTHDTSRCTACRGNKTAVPDNLFQSKNLTAVSDKNGKVVFNEKIPSGHIYLLTEGALPGYHPLDETYLVKVAYDTNTVTKIVNGKEENVGASDFTVINENVYKLPETGGPGRSDYAKAGIVLLLLATAFCPGCLKQKRVRGDE